MKVVLQHLTQVAVDGGFWRGLCRGNKGLMLAVAPLGCGLERQAALRCMAGPSA